MSSKQERSFTKEFFSYPSSLWLALQGVALLTIMAWASFFLSWVAGLLIVIFAILRARRIMSNTPAPFDNPKNIFITGASSGIGEYMAYKYAREGAAYIYLTGRNEERLKTVCAKVEENAKKSGNKDFVKAVIVKVDVTDVEAMRTEMQRADENCGGLDVVYANAGVSASVLPKDISTEQMCRTVLDINVTGILNTVFPVYDRFLERGRGQYVIIASIAGIASLPGNHPYSASKAAAISFGQGLRRELAAVSPNLGVTVICPGFVKSALTKERAEKVGLPFLMETDTCCDIIYNAVRENLDVCSFPLPTYFGGWIMRIMPFFLHDQISTFVAEFMYPKNLDQLPVKAQ